MFISFLGTREPHAKPTGKGCLYVFGNSSESSGVNKHRRISLIDMHIHLICISLIHMHITSFNRESMQHSFTKQVGSWDFQMRYIHMTYDKNIHMRYVFYEHKNWFVIFDFTFKGDSNCDFTFKTLPF